MNELRERERERVIHTVTHTRANEHEHKEGYTTHENFTRHTVTGREMVVCVWPPKQPTKEPEKSHQG